MEPERDNGGGQPSMPHLVSSFTDIAVASTAPPSDMDALQLATQRSAERLAQFSEAELHEALSTLQCAITALGKYVEVLEPHVSAAHAPTSPRHASPGLITDETSPFPTFSLEEDWDSFPLDDEDPL